VSTPTDDRHAVPETDDPTTDSAALLAAAQAWLEDDPDPETRDELHSLISDDRGELARRFAGRLQFGTAGLRGPVAAGPMGMNRVTVQRATAGFARYLLDTVDEAAARGVVIGHDARRNSDVFALDTARVLAGMGIRALLLPPLSPTPVTAFSVTLLGAAGGVMVTASHNPPADNGYKVYLASGAQITPPHDEEIASRIDAVARVRDLVLADPHDPLIERLGDAPRDAYLAHATTARFVPELTDVVVAYTPMHGVGGETLLAAFAAAGFAPPFVVAEQFEPDGTFPTVAFPNPEEPGAMDLLVARATRVGADIALANDPDADRLGAAIPLADGSWRALRGDEIGWLLADHVLSHTTGDDRLVVTTLVSSSLLAELARDYGVQSAETATGFKWIARAALDRPELRLVFGYEQALGYLVGNRPLDKDGISAALTMAEVSALAKRDGVSLQDRLDAIAERFGRHVTAERSIRLTPAEATVAMAALRADPPAALGGVAVLEVTDIPIAGLVRLTCAGGTRVQVRPSGTEPKVKLYGEAIGSDPGPLLDELAARLVR
jgi:phosphomannomutase